MPVRSGGAWFTAFSPPVSGSVLRVIKIRRHQDKGSPMLDAHQLLWTQIAAGACLLISGGLLFNLFRMRGQMRAASTWNRIEGVIIASEVRQPPSHLSDDLNDATPLIRYRFRA